MKRSSCCGTMKKSMQRTMIWMALVQRLGPVASRSASNKGQVWSIHGYFGLGCGKM